MSIKIICTRKDFIKALTLALANRTHFCQAYKIKYPTLLYSCSMDIYVDLPRQTQSLHLIIYVSLEVNISGSLVTVKRGIPISLMDSDTLVESKIFTNLYSR